VRHTGSPLTILILILLDMCSMGTRRFPHAGGRKSKGPRRAHTIRIPVDRSAFLQQLADERGIDFNDVALLVIEAGLRAGLPAPAVSGQQRLALTG
jgi:hypothetical protein